MFPYSTQDPILKKLFRVKFHSLLVLANLRSLKGHVTNLTGQCHRRVKFYSRIFLRHWGLIILNSFFSNFPSATYFKSIFLLFFLILNLFLNLFLCFLCSFFLTFVFLHFFFHFLLLYLSKCFPIIFSGSVSFSSSASYLCFFQNWSFALFIRMSFSFFPFLLPSSPIFSLSFAFSFFGGNFILFFHVEIRRSWKGEIDFQRFLTSNASLRRKKPESEREKWILHVLKL